MVMANQETPHFEDFEPEGDDFGSGEDYANGPVFESEAPHAYPEGPLGEYEFEDFEFEYMTELDELGVEPEGSELAEDWASVPPRPARGTPVGNNRRAAEAPALKGNGRKPPAPARPSQAEGLDEPAPAPFAGPRPVDQRAWSAGLREDMELMQALAAVAAKTRSSAEAEGLAAAMVPLALRLAPHAYRGLWPALPALLRGAAAITRRLHRRPATRRFIQLLPAILQNTTAQLARHAGRGRPLSPHMAEKVLARQAALTWQERRGSYRSYLPES